MGNICVNQLDVKEEMKEIRKERPSPSNNNQNTIQKNLNDQLPPKEKLMQTIRDGVIGANTYYQTPYGLRRITYCDYVASGKPLTFIEDFIRNEVLPHYANVHTLTSHTGKQTSCFREEARRIIKECTSCSEKDSIIFTGSGVTGVANLMCHLTFKKLERLEDKKKMIFFHGIIEHHSNYLPFLEKGAEMITIPISEKSGTLDYEFLEKEVQKYAEDKSNFLVGSFSAASNVTGIQTDTNKLTKIMHKYGGLAFFDFACAAPYVKIEMNCKDESGETIEKDGIMISPHKFMGGAGTPGLFLVKNHMVEEQYIPYFPGGGTVSFVGIYPRKHRYAHDNSQRFEGGTPEIIGSIRAGLVFQLKSQVGEELIEKKEHEFISTAISRLSKRKNFVVMGSKKAKRVSVLSFLIQNKRTKLFLHAKFVTRLLNDLFGIQSRAGCLCAGLYSQVLLGFDEKYGDDLLRVLVQEKGKKTPEILRPGFTRVSFNYFISKEEFEFMLNALEFVTEHGWKFLSSYEYTSETGEFHHQKEEKMESHGESKFLNGISYESGELEFASICKLNKGRNNNTTDFNEYLQQAKEELKKIEESIPKDISNEHILENKEINKLRWFLLPTESQKMLVDENWKSEQICPINPINCKEDENQPTQEEIKIESREK